MSANEFSNTCTSTSKSEDSNSTCTFKFTQSTPVPSYLIALAAGNLESRSIGPRSRVWCEPELLDRAAWEFTEIESFIVAGEQITGFPYIWGRCDILLLPTSFPYGGMENPCLTFLNSSLVTGDRSLIDVLAHEIAHSWTGNLVTAANWNHFWLNEGFTMFLERKILARVHGNNEALRQLHAICGLADLKEAIDYFGPKSSATLLVTDLSETDPDDFFSSIPYEKGHTFLAFLEESVGGPGMFEPFLRAYIQKFSYQSITSDDFVDLFKEFFGPKISDEIQWHGWLHTPGAPPKIPNYDRSLMLPCEDLMNSILLIDEIDSVKLDRFSDLKFDQKIVFLDLLSQKLETEKMNITPEHLEIIMKHLETEFALKHETNVEICLRWYLMALRSKYVPDYLQVSALNFIISQGRMKYNRPIYRELCKLNQNSCRIVQDTFRSNRKFYHPIAAKMIEKDLKECLLDESNK